MCPDRERTFSDSTAEPHMRAWASTDGSGDKDKMDWDKYASVHFWRDPNNTQAFAGYKLKFCDMVDGKVNAIWHAITVAGVEVDGGRGGLDVPEADKPGIRDKIGGYYAKARDAYNDPSIQAPWHDAGKSTKPPLAKRMLSTLEIKAVAPTADASGRRWFEGIASTPSTDRTGDTVQPKGAKFKLPLPLLYQHDSMQPIGQVTEASVKPSGIYVKGYVEQVDGPPTLKERLDVAYTEMKLGLVRGLSIGFNPLESAPIDAKNPWGGMDYTSWEWLELSPVTIAANQDASITTIKSIAERTAPALGQMASAKTKGAITNLPGASGKAVAVATSPKGKSMKPYQEQIRDAEAKIAALEAAKTQLVNDAAEKGMTLEQAQKDEYRKHSDEIKELVDHIAILKDQEVSMLKGAQQVTPTTGIATGDQPKSTGVRYEIGKSSLPAGMGLARYVKALAYAKGNYNQASEYAKQWDVTSPEVGLALKAAVAAGTTTDSSWAGPLVYNQNIASEFVAFLRPQTILGKLTGTRPVPFNIRYVIQNTGSTVSWVGEGAAKPVSKLTYSQGTLGFAKAAGIVVISQELARYSSPSAELNVRDDLTAQMVEFLDQQFIDPGVAAVANVNPASVTNNSSNIVQSANIWNSLTNIIADTRQLLFNFAAQEISLDNSYWIMTPNTAIALSLIYTTNGQQQFPGITVTGGVFLGLPVIVSNSVPHSVSAGAIVALVKASEIQVADDGQVAIDVSQEASLQMDSAPSQNSTGTPTASSVVSMFQTNSIAVRCERVINWAKRRTYAVGYVDNVHTS